MRHCIYILFIVLTAVLGSCASTSRVPLGYKTAIAPEAQITVDYNGKTMTLPCQVQIRRDSLIAVSLSPIKILGEVLRIEATDKQVTVYERLTRRYASFDWAELSQWAGRRLNLRVVERTILRQSHRMVFSTSQMTLRPIVGEVNYNQPLTLRPLRMDFYRQTDLPSILKVLQ